MKPVSIGRLSVWFVIAASILVVGLGGYFWLEIRQASAALLASEREGAQQEVRQALQSVERRMHATAQNLAQWEETRQQLVFPEYYPLWRDSRVRDAGMITPDVKAVALYDKAGLILTKQLDALPDRLPLLADVGFVSAKAPTTPLPGKPPLVRYVAVSGQPHLEYFIPIFADPSTEILLGYLGMKFDLLAELKRAHSFRYANLASLKVTLPGNSQIDVGNSLEHLRFETVPNPNLVALLNLFKSAQLRLTLAVLVSLFIAAWLLKRLLVHPLRSLSNEINAMRTVDDNLPHGLISNTPLYISELESVRRAFSDYQERLSSLHENLAQNSRDFFDQARHDALTGVFNRRAYDEDWRSLGEDRRLGKAALLLFDCDHFKAINDTYGHAVGDAVIMAIARCLQSALRMEDKLYRLGGDEFATVLLDADPQHAEIIAERCLEHIMAHDFRQYGMSEPATISIGVAHSHAGDLHLVELQKRADLAMYAAKSPASPKMVTYSEGMGELKALVANQSINAVFQAIRDANLIELSYQAVMRLPMVHREYVEALTRIRLNGELIRPDSIFPIVQARKLDAEFDLSVIRAITRDLGNGRLPAGQGVSINLSAPSIVNAKVVDAMLELVRSQTGRKIVVEITETALITQMETASANIEQLRQAGALVALDDFGSGYSSLRYLATMPVDLVKFDISMVRMLEKGDPRQKLILEEIAGMVLTAGYQLVAEGIETRAQLDKIIGMGFTHAQGFYFGKPGEEIEPMNKP
jgi:diguanylate cyclase (GGDEF)-like protein